MSKISRIARETAAEDIVDKLRGPFSTIYADPPWRFHNRTGKMAPEHRRLLRYPTMSFEEIFELPVGKLAAAAAHLYLWVPNALIAQGLEAMRRWGFTYKTNIVWYKVRRDGGPDGRGVGFYFRNVTELLLFGVRGNMRTLKPGRRQVNIVVSRKREHSRKPDEIYEIIEACSPAPYVELFARHPRPGWVQWGNEHLQGESGYPPRTQARETQAMILESQEGYRSRREKHAKTTSKLANRGRRHATPPTCGKR